MNQTSSSTASSVLSYLGPLVAVALGWALHELSDVVRLRREDRRVAGKALAEILELRHGVRAVPSAMNEIRKRTPIPPEAESMIRGIFAPYLSKLMEGASVRYNTAIDSLSGRLPLLAFELRSKDQFSPILEQLRAFASTDPNAAASIAAVEDNLTQQFLPLLDKLALKLAQLHGWRTWLRLRRRLKTPDDRSADLNEVLDSLFKSAGIAQPPA